MADCKCAVCQTHMVCVGLAELYTDEELQRWWHTPQRLLGWKSPSSLIFDGRGDEVLRLVNQMREGAYL